MKPLSPEWNADMIGRLYYAYIAMNNKRIGELLIEISNAKHADEKSWMEEETSFVPARKAPTYKYVESIEELIEAQNNGERIEFRQEYGLPEPKWAADNNSIPFTFCFPIDRYRIVL